MMVMLVMRRASDAMNAGNAGGKASRSDTCGSRRGMQRMDHVDDMVQESPSALLDRVQCKSVLSWTGMNGDSCRISCGSWRNRKGERWQDEEDSRERKAAAGRLSRQKQQT